MAWVGMNHALKPMKTSVLRLLAAVALVVPAAGQSAEQFYQQGLAAEKSGNAEAARTAYASALQANPNHAGARYRIGEMKIHGEAISAKGREAKFDTVTLPQLQLENASLKEALDALALTVEKESGGELVPNFIIQDRGETLANASISLQLKNIPASGAMNYILTQAGAKARHDAHAVVITPR